MSKEALVDQIVANTGLSKKDATAAISQVTQAVTDLMVKGQDISLIGFGKFSVKDVPARTGRNPSTGAEIQIAARKQVKFTPGKGLKDAVN
ncbi:HU family DNA-binding protein [Thiomicrospira cyclica]|jgi:DNA-binding protein HU-beta|uniref:Histone family protein DNA-binding protein n=1 Tax=Thiomicrospira cyclica (strain DSM 14477 / JCM 11371 / ALM1) TaxID=717773 RepID=F6D9C4_THICA|nr:HU family DNA-binding protein [Thiomicrospira cyclica]AEG32051.1 histone family protein DNA-binding protein [Thiomicrospira cyclica ALM1]